MQISRILLALFLPIVATCHNSPESFATTNTTENAAQPTPPPKTDLQADEALAKECEKCHASANVLKQPDVPFIAGQSVTYLLAAMDEYKKGARKSEPMKEAIATLDEKALFNVASYYAEQSPQWQGVLLSKTAPKPRTSQKTINEGKALSGSCIGCHGEDGNSQLTGIPSLAGLQQNYLETSLAAYFSGARKDTVMTNFRHAINKQQIKQISAYYASLTRQKTKIASQGNGKAGKSAAQACIGCHDAEGNSITPTMPSLSGQNAEYLVNAITAYQKGKRDNAMMQNQVKKLDTTTIQNLAAYYAAQTPREPNEPAGETEGFNPVTEGKAVAATCNGCHGPDGNSRTARTPSLTRQHRDYLIKAINAYKNGGRKNDVMAPFVSQLNDLTIENVSLYYSTVEPQLTKNKIKGNPESGEKISAGCSGCHGDKGNSTQALVPSLAGQDPRYLLNAIAAYAGGKRDNSDMLNAVKDLGEQAVKDVATYYAEQTPLLIGARLPEAPEELAVKCNRCHGEQGNSTDPKIPKITAQSEAYIRNVLLAYQSKERTHSTMYAMAADLSLSEITAIARYYAGQK